VSQPLLVKPAGAQALLVFAHGAGAGMRHRWMEAMADLLAARGIATWRYEFPYMAAGKRRPDAPAVAQAAVREAVTAARGAAPELPVVAGGKSFGGRMTSQAEAAQPLGVRGLVFFGWPLHPPGRPGTQRAEHLRHVTIPMLFLQGTRDALAGRALLTPVVQALPTATLDVIERGDHSLERRRGDATGPAEAADHAAAWITTLL
jgi:hypothetical protein